MKIPLVIPGERKPLACVREGDPGLQFKLDFDI